MDDKIILRGRQQHLLSEFTSKHPDLDDTVVSTATEAFDAYIQKNLFLLPPDLKPEVYDAEAKKVYQAVLDGKSLVGNEIPAVDMHLKTASSAAAALNLVQNDKGSVDVVEFYPFARWFASYIFQPIRGLRDDAGRISQLGVPPYR